MFHIYKLVVGKKLLNEICLMGQRNAYPRANVSSDIYGRHTMQGKKNYTIIDIKYIRKKSQKGSKTSITSP